LRLNDEEVDELMNITNRVVNGLPRQDVVFSWANLRCKTLLEEHLARNFSRHRDTERHPGELEGISEQVQVSASEDRADDSDVCDGRSTRVLPAQEAGEEGVVVCEVLAGGRGL
jgi:hypothetical protein